MDNETSEPERPQSVLLIDDNEGVLSAMTGLLEISGFDVHAIDSGDKVMALLETGFEPDILITDYRLPSLTGIEIVHLTRKKLDSTIPAIILSGDTSASEIQNHSLEKCAVLQKPCPAETLFDTISKLTT